MRPFQRIGRRQYLCDSALGMGAAPLVTGAPLPANWGTPAHTALTQNSPTSNSNSLRMLAGFGSIESVWIVREPQAGFQEQLASCELARGF
jgi:hypothetical protein